VSIVASNDDPVRELVEPQGQTSSHELTEIRPASDNDANHFSISGPPSNATDYIASRTDSITDHIASPADHDLRPASTSVAADPSALARPGEDQFVFNANLGHNSNSDFHAGIDATHAAQPIFLTVADILNHAAQADLGAAVAQIQDHAVGLSLWQKDKPLTDFIVHG
jgi:hypothetical protein